jgi:hypothetical protein
MIRSGSRLGTIHKLQESPFTAASNWTPLMCKQHKKLSQSNEVIITVSDMNVMQRHLQQMKTAVIIRTVMVMVAIKVYGK